MKNNNIITIDGPSASGKGSLAKALAKKLNFILLDSGLLYRAYSYCFDLSQNHSGATELFSNLRIDNIEHEMHVFEQKKDITSILRHENVAKSASKLSSLKETRDNLISFHKWHKSKLISQKCNILVFDRHGYKKNSLKSKTFKQLNKDVLKFIEFKKVNISSSQLRKI